MYLVVVDLYVFGSGAVRVVVVTLKVDGERLCVLLSRRTTVSHGDLYLVPVNTDAVSRVVSPARLYHQLVAQRYKQKWILSKTTQRTVILERTRKRKLSLIYPM